MSPFSQRAYQNAEAHVMRFGSKRHSELEPAIVEGRCEQEKLRPQGEFPGANC